MPAHNTIPVKVMYQNGGYSFRTYFSLDYLPSNVANVSGLNKFSTEKNDDIQYNLTRGDEV